MNCKVDSHIIQKCQLVPVTDRHPPLFYINGPGSYEFEKQTIAMLAVENFSIKKQILSLIGVLQLVAICIKPGRVFMVRLLNFPQEYPELGKQ